MNRIAVFFASFAIVALATLASVPASYAAPPAPQPVTLPCATDMSVQVLGNAQPAASEGQSLVLVRAIFGPGGGIGPHTHPGTLIVTVESGTFGFTLEDHGEMPIMRSGDAGTPAVPEMAQSGEELVLNPGDWFVETGMTHSARNLGEEPVTVIFTGLVEAGQPVTACAA